ncbi:MAG: hypothetical protein J0I43_14280 [Microbacterium sp.]|uniref:hypothetical protein n=1 Tax=Microbacterium sp. TaxID=51671 RepID=UPI001AC485FA|nr:hypothetical protein [Microbacterium sp.]MBN9178516.1 hypothetical protein [Microbacterium sp.]
MAERAGASAALVAVGAAVAALSGVAFLAITARSLTTEQNTAFLTFWAALFALFAVLSGIQNEVTRAVRADSMRTGDHDRKTSPLASALIVGAAAALVVLALTPLWGVVLVDDTNLIFSVVVMGAAAFLYAGHVAAVGTFAGLGRWRAFAGLTAGESVVRLALAVVGAVAGWSVDGFATAAAAGAVTWVAATLSMPGWRTVWSLRVAIGRGALIGRILNAMAASGANALLVTGFPLLMSATTDPSTYASAAPVVMAVSMTRAPLLIPITAFQSMVIAAFVEHPERARSSLLRLLLLVVAVALVGGGLAALVGPWLMALVFGPAYANTPAILALLVAAAAFLALLVLGGAIALALDEHAVNTVGWYLAFAVSTAIMLMPLDLATRTVLALMIGPMVGSAFHFIFVLRALRRRESRATAT